MSLRGIITIIIIAAFAVAAICSDEIKKIVNKSDDDHNNFSE